MDGRGPEWKLGEQLEDCSVRGDVDEMVCID